MITLEDYFGRMSHIEEPSEEVIENAEVLLTRVNKVLAYINEKFPGIEAAENPVVNSGWRPASYNAGVPGAATKSKHIIGKAIDLSDPEGELDDFFFKHTFALSDFGLYLEHPLSTKNWCHLQSEAPKSGNLVFYP